MTFGEWYSETYPDLKPEYDDFYEQLKKCWEDSINKATK